MSCIKQITVLPGAGSDEAMKLMREIAAWVEPLMKKYGWVVGVFAEKNFASPHVLGMNTGAGEIIQIRLRRAGKEFYPLESLIDTMLHELSHNTHGNHSAEFYALWEKLRAELSVNMAKGIKGGQGFETKGHKLGGYQASTAREGRDKAIQAAEKRLNQSKIMGSGTVGGNSGLIQLQAAEAARIATLDRCSDWCGSAAPQPVSWGCEMCTFQKQRRK